MEIEPMRPATATLYLPTLLQSKTIESVQVECDLNNHFPTNTYKPIYFRIPNGEGGHTKEETRVSTESIKIKCALNALLSEKDLQDTVSAIEKVKNAIKSFQSRKEALLNCWRPAEIKQNLVFQYLKKDIDDSDPWVPATPMINEWRKLIQEMKNIWHAQLPANQPSNPDVISVLESLNRNTERFRMRGGSKLGKDDIIFFLSRWDNGQIQGRKPINYFEDFDSAGLDLGIQLKNFKERNSLFLSKGALCLLPRNSGIKENDIVDHSDLEAKAEYNPSNSFPIVFQVLLSTRNEDKE
jgi:hypothetical protein